MLAPGMLMVYINVHDTFSAIIQWELSNRRRGPTWLIREAIVRLSSS
jgi:hypothetical protein